MNRNPFMQRQPVCKGRLWKLWIQTKQNWIKNCATLHNEDYVSQSPHNRKISTCKILPHPNIKTGLPDRVGAHLTCRTGSEPKVQIWMCQKGSKFVQFQMSEFMQNISKSTWPYVDRKGKPLGSHPAVRVPHVEKPICQSGHACWACRVPTIIA